MSAAWVMLSSILDFGRLQFLAVVVGHRSQCILCALVHDLTSVGVSQLAFELGAVWYLVSECPRLVGDPTAVGFGNVALASEVLDDAAIETQQRASSQP
jgi:hypothetical protein